MEFADIEIFKIQYVSNFSSYLWIIASENILKTAEHFNVQTLVFSG